MARKGFLIILVLLALLAPRVPAQSEQDFVVEMGFEVTTPGAEVALPVNLAARGERKITRLMSEISFENKWLDFVEAKLAASAEAAGAEIESEVLQEGLPPGESIIKITVRAEQPLPNGDLFLLTLRVSKEAESAHTIMLENKVTLWTEEGAEVTNVATTAGEVIVSGPPPPQFGCFFYMH